MMMLIRSYRRWILRGAVFLIFGYILLLGGMYGFQRHLQYFPDTSPPDLAATSVPDMKQIVIKTADGLSLMSWIYMHPDQKVRDTVIFFHGNAQNIAARDHKARRFIDAGYNILLLEYRGFGGNPGAPFENGMMMDARAGVETLAHTYHIPVARMIFYGESIGTGIAVQAAADYQDIRALILEVPFDSALDVAQGRYPMIFGLSYLMHDQYRSDLWIGHLKMPKLILAAGRDWVIPPRHARRLFDLAAEPKEWAFFEKSGHNTVYDYGAFDVIHSFLKGRASDARGAEQQTGGTDKKMLAGPGGDADAALASLPELTIYRAAGDAVLVRFRVELAQTPDAQARGLMGRDHLPDGQGMLFLFDRDDVVHFWMKNTYLPLDMLFIAADGRIVHIHEQARPGDETPISSQKPVRAALEIAGGQVQKHGIKIGQYIDLKEFLTKP